MRNKRLSLTDPAEAAVLDQITVRLVRPEEQARWDQLVSEHHYLENANLVGERVSGGEGGHRAVATFARDLTPIQRARVHCWFNWRTRQYEAPSENCIFMLFAKGNQDHLLDQAKHFLPEDFSPSTAAGRAGSWPD